MGFVSDLCHFRSLLCHCSLSLYTRFLTLHLSSFSKPAKHKIPINDCLHYHQNAKSPIKLLQPLRYRHPTLDCRLADETGIHKATVIVARSHGVGFVVSWIFAGNEGSFMGVGLRFIDFLHGLY